MTAGPAALLRHYGFPSNKPLGNALNDRYGRSLQLDRPRRFARDVAGHAVDAARLVERAAGDAAVESEAERDTIGRHSVRRVPTNTKAQPCRDGAMSVLERSYCHRQDSRLGTWKRLAACHGHTAVPKIAFSLPVVQQDTP